MTDNVSRETNTDDGSEMGDVRTGVRRYNDQRTIRSLMTFCRENKVRRVVWRDFECEFAPEAFLSDTGEEVPAPTATDGKPTDYVSDIERQSLSRV